MGQIGCRAGVLNHCDIQYLLDHFLLHSPDFFFFFNQSSLQLKGCQKNRLWVLASRTLNPIPSSKLCGLGFFYLP